MDVFHALCNLVLSNVFLCDGKKDEDYRAVAKHPLRPIKRSLMKALQRMCAWVHVKFIASAA
jgi:hypothetical protein